MQFAIQTSNPIATGQISDDDMTLGEAIESIFPLLTEFAIIIWHDVYVPLNYKYDVSVMFEDILAMMSAIATREFGDLSIDWPSNTFCAKWRLSWKANELSIETHWTSVLGGAEEMLNACPQLTMDKNQFLAEWCGLIRIVRNAIFEVSHSSTALGHLSTLDTAICQVTIPGCLYATEG
jgi:hypothetical protein